MSWAEIKEAIEKQGTAFDEFKKVNDERIDEIRKGNEAKATELGTKLDKIEKDLQGFSKLKKEIEIEMQFQKERIEELETRSKQPGKTAQEKNHDEYKANWIKWVRNKGIDSEAEIKMTDLMRKDVTIGTPSSGGYAVPEEI
ncbi:MAG TPA: phage major capsid protein, partial [Steroidobacteraceae bacterium]|nr:phage major capsid protein [Steroidobacteraceae bacterium]